MSRQAWFSIPNPLAPAHLRRRRGQARRGGKPPIHLPASPTPLLVIDSSAHDEDGHDQNGSFPCVPCRSTTSTLLLVIKSDQKNSIFYSRADPRHQQPEAHPWSKGCSLGVNPNRETESSNEVPRQTTSSKRHHDTGERTTLLMAQKLRMAQKDCVQLLMK